MPMQRLMHPGTHYGTRERALTGLGATWYSQRAGAGTVRAANAPMDALKNLELLITSRYPVIVVYPGTCQWASHSPRATAASPSNDIVEIPSPRSKAPSPAAVTGLSARNTVTCVGVAWPSAQSQR
jgi:hypothetical protein